MKTTQITQRTLIESYIRNNNATTAGYMRTMNENFVVPFNKSLLLNEVALDANTINSIFAQAQQGMTDQGANRTALGKGADVAGAVGDAAVAGAKGAVDLAKKGAKGVKELADKILNQNKANFEQSLPPANAGEVQNFEQQATQAAEQIQDPKAKQSVMDLVKQGLKNPVAQTMILTAIGGIATVVAGPAIAGLGLGAAATGALTGTVVGGLTKLAQAKMQGKDWKEAGKDALKGAGMGAAVGGIGGAIVQGAQALAGNKPYVAQGAEGGMDGMSDAQINRAMNKGEADAAAVSGQDISGTTGVQQQQAAQQAQNDQALDASLMKKNADMTAAAAKHSYHDGTPMDAPPQQAAQQQPAPEETPYPSAGKVRPNLNQWRQNVGSPNAVQESIDRQQTARRWILQESLGRERSGYVLTPEAINSILEGKIGDWFKKVGSNLTNKVTADKLKTAWNKAGMPNDSEAIAGILSQAGVGQAVVQDIYKKLGIPTTAGTGQQAPAAPKQGMLGKAAGAVGGAIGAAKGAVQGAKDAYAGQQAQSQADARAAQGGEFAGASDAQNNQQQDTPSQPAQQGATAQAQAPQGTAQQPQAQASANNAQGAQQPAKAGQAQASANNAQQPQAQGYEPAQNSQDNEPGTAQKLANKFAGALGDVQSAMQAGAGMGAAGQSLMQTGKAAANTQSIKDAQGKTHQYKKVGQKWINIADNSEVDPATSAMLTRQEKQGAAAQTANAEMGKNAQQPAQAKAGQQQPHAAGGEQQPAQAQAAPAGKKPIAAPDSGGEPTTQAQRQAHIDAGGTFDDETGMPMPVAGAQAQAKAGQQQPQAAGGEQQPAQAQSPEEIRKAKQATAAKTAQDQMAANAATPAGQPAVWKNNRAPEGTPASTSPQAAAATAQQAGGKDVQARIAKQLTPNFGQQQPGYASVKMNAPTGVPNPLGQPQPTTGAKAVPAQQPAPQTASAQADQGKPGFLQSKLKGRQPEMAGIDFSAALLRKMKTRL